jgi:hypothetical protein
MALQQRTEPHVTSLIRFKSGRPDGEDSPPMAGFASSQAGRRNAFVTNLREAGR